MIVVSYNMSSADYPRPHLATSSPDFLATVDYPLRPAVTRTWGTMSSRQSAWRNCYFPHSFPVYRMQRLVSVALCLLALVLLSLVAFVLVQVTPSAQVLRSNGAVLAPDMKNSDLGVSTQDKTKLEVGVGVGMTVRKLEDHPEYSDNAEEDYNDDDDDDDDDDDYDDGLDEENDDDLILDDNYDEYDNEEEDEYNPVFDMKYFDFSLKEGGNDVNIEDKPGNQEGEPVAGAPSAFTFRTPKVREKWRGLPKVNLVNDNGVNVVEDGVVFSPEMEALLKEPQMNDAALGKVQEELRTLRVKRLQDPTWDRCGRPKNQWVELVGGVTACARYRYPDVQLLVGEVVSFYLSRLLNVSHVPPPVLASPVSPQWSSVSSQMTQAGWGEASVVVLTPWVHGLVRDHMPSVLLDTLLKNNTLNIVEEEPQHETVKEMKASDVQKHKLHKVTEVMGKEDIKHNVNKEPEEHEEQETVDFRENRLLKGATEKDLVQLLQWSDLLVFDYLTGNYDRVAYMQDAAEKEGRPQILSGTIHNLVRSETTGALWLLDNESGLMDAYMLLYGTTDPAQSARFHSFHNRMLNSICIFRRSTMEVILGLVHHTQPHEFLIKFVKDHEPLFSKLPDPLNNDMFVKYFPQRVREVHNWMTECAEKVRRGTRKNPLRH